MWRTFRRRSLPVVCVSHRSIQVVWACAVFRGLRCPCPLWDETSPPCSAVRRMDPTLIKQWRTLPPQHTQTPKTTPRGSAVTPSPLFLYPTCSPAVPHLPLSAPHHPLSPPPPPPHLYSSLLHCLFLMHSGPTTKLLSNNESYRKSITQ